MRRIACLSIILLFSFRLFAHLGCINDGWKFSKDKIDDTRLLVIDNYSWENVNLPHTWNAYDGQDGKDDYYRGVGWYLKELWFDKADRNKQIYLRFGAANNAADVYINGRKVGSHFGGYTAFAFDITSFIQYGESNTLLVKVNNSKELALPPVSADFTFFGGLIREVEIIRKNKIHITCEDYGSQGVYVKQANVSGRKADISVAVKVRNTESKNQDVTIRFVIKDADGRIIKDKKQNRKIAAMKTMSIEQSFGLEHPHLWNGVEDPYLYRTETYLYAGAKELDCIIEPLGIRHYTIDPDKGFALNGVSYPLRGASMHEERMNKGNAVSDQERKEDIDMLVDMGCNYIRLSHYQHGKFTYNYLDSLGVICWTEIPLINQVIDTEEFTENCRHEMISLIRQNYNHPCIVVWGISNEINYHKGPDPVPLLKALNELAHKEDPSRMTTLAAMFSERATNFITDVYSNNRYDGWYYSKIEDIADFLDNLHRKYPKRSIGISEYGAGAHPYQHEEGYDKPNENGHWHPEGFQALFHEIYLKAIQERPFLWSTSIWAAFDFASDNRNEGNQPGINDKGLITRDRLLKKDTYYFYKANWNKAPMVYICSRRFMKRTNANTAIKIYSNCDQVTLIVNGKEHNLQQEENCIFLSDEIELSEGENKISAIGSRDGDGMKYEDHIIWYYKK